MDKPRTSPTLAFLAILLVMLLLYVGSYLALVKPGGVVVQGPWRSENGELVVGNWCYHYHFGEQWAEEFFWPLEQFDRKVRPEKWR